MSNSTLLRADRATHLKIIAISLLAGILVVGVGLSARTPTGNGAAQFEDNGVRQAGQPVNVTSRETATIR